MKEKVSEIVRDLKFAINSGVWKPSEKLPSENGIAIKTNCSRMTARKALIQLKNEGYLTSRKGRGYFVSMGHEKVDFKARGDKVEGDFQFHVVKMQIGKKSTKIFKEMDFDIDSDEFKFIFMVTQFNSHRKPYTVLHSFLNTRLLPNASTEGVKNSLHSFLARNNVKVKRRVVKVIIVPAPQVILIKLNMNQHTKVVASHIVLYNDKDEVIHYAIRYTLLDCYSQTFEIDY